MQSSKSLRTIIFSIIFAILLVLTTAVEDGSAQKDDNDVINQEVPIEQNNYWPAVHLRGLRSSNGKPTFIRFGKRGSPSFIRFGRK